MANQRAILCGSAPSGDIPFEDADPVRLRRWGPHRNVHLTIEDVRRAMWRDVPAVFHDLIDIATYVYCGDQAVTRGGGGVDEVGANWRRTLFFRIPVRCPDFWKQRSVQGELIATLSFLSDDEYHFDFVPLLDAPELQRSFNFVDTAFTGTVDEVMLFSGGLDSLGGAAQESLIDKRRVLLVNHRSTEKLTPRHRHLLHLLNEQAGVAAPIHIPVHINKQKQLGREYTQRSRSFLYAALGATIASMVGLNRIRFYENGIVSLNLPLSAQVVGARATRTTHPRVLRGFERLFSLIAEKPIAVENRFLWKTKTDVVRLIADSGCGELIKFATSCTHTWEMTKQHTHCGVCSQCIDRRFAMLAADQEANDPGEAYKVDLLTGERADGDPRTMLAAYVETANQIESMDAQGFFSSYGEAFRVLPHLNGNPDAVAMEIFDLHRRHAKQVTGVVDAALKKHVQDIRRRKLPASCLLRLVSDSSAGGSQESSGPSPGAPPQPADYTFRKKGQAWEVRFAGGPDFILLPSKGAAYLQILLSHAGQPISAVDLACRVSKHPERFSLGSAGGTADKEALTAYHARLQELNEEMEEAKENLDTARQVKIEEEREWIRKEVRRHTGLGGKPRKDGDDRDRVRKAVGIAIRRTIREIENYDANLAAHLKAPVLRCGLSPCYSPSTGIHWET